MKRQRKQVDLESLSAIYSPQEYPSCLKFRRLCSDRLELSSGAPKVCRLDVGVLLVVVVDRRLDSIYMYVSKLIERP